MTCFMVLFFQYHINIFKYLSGIRVVINKDMSEDEKEGVWMMTHHPYPLVYHTLSSSSMMKMKVGDRYSAKVEFAFV